MLTTKEGKLMDTVDKVRSKMAHVSSSSSSTSKGWEDLWKDGLTPWDLGQPTPLLIKELEQKRNDLLLRETSFEISNGIRYSLVPGCGSGYDLVTLQRHQSEQYEKTTTIVPNNSFSTTSSLKHIVVGLDLSPTALQKAESVVKHHSNDTVTSIQLRCGDFFDNPASWKQVYSPSALTQTKNENGIPESQKFDMIFDYTFFCALHPSLRLRWGEQMAKLLHPTRGRLLTIIFPILPQADPIVGPPYPVSIEDYCMALEPYGIQKDGREPYESSQSVPSRKGKELVCFWKFRTANDPSML
jgi:methyl halide transferase